MKLDLQKRTTVFQNQLLGLHNGKEFNFIENTNHVVNILKLLWRYGYNLKSLQNVINNMLDKFERSENE